MSGSMDSGSHEIYVEEQEVGLITPSDGYRRRQAWQQLILLLHSIEVFISRANYNNNNNNNNNIADHHEGSSPAPSMVSSPATTPYTVINSGDPKDEDCIILEIADSLPASHEDSSSFSSIIENNHRSIELQRCQSANITKIVKDKNLDLLRVFGSVEGIADALDTDLKKGIPGDKEDLARRRPNTLSQTQAPLPAFFQFLFEACNNYTIFVLVLIVVLSIAFAVKEEGLQNCGFQGALLILTIIILITFPATRNYLLEKRSREKADKKTLSKEREMQVDVVRGGSPQQISMEDVVRGDIVFLKKGYHVPADGLFVAGEALELDDGLQSIIDDENPFLSYDVRVINGNARMIVTSVGMNTAWSEMMSTAMDSSTKKITLESRLDKVSTCTHWAGLLICIIVPVALFLRFLLGKMDDENGYGASKGEPTALRVFVNALKSIIIEPKGTTRVLTLLCISLVGIVEGIPFVITLAIAYWNRKALSDKDCGLDLLACVNMGSITTICTDKIGGLTQHQVEVDKFWIGKDVISESFEISSDVLEALCYGIGTSNLIPQTSSSSTEAALHCWAEEKLGMRKESLKQNCTILKRKESNYLEEPCGVLMEKKGDSGHEMYLHWIGPANKILANCSHYYDCKGKKHDMGDQVSKQANRDMTAFAFRPTDDQKLEENNLILIGMLGLKNTKWEETRKAIETFMAGGVKTILVSGADVSALKPIALECGLLTLDPDPLVLRGEDFRNFTHKERMEKVDRIRILGNSQPSDKLLLIKCLREKGEIVAAIGQRTNDAPALKEADIGLAMGSWSAEKVKEISDIIILDGNFSFSVSMFKIGRCVFNNIQKFIQLELIMTISGSLINFLATIFSGDASMTALELFWVNLVVAFLGGLALLTEPPTEKLMNMSPISPNGPLITLAMWRNIVTQALYQVGISVTLLYKGQAILGISEEAGKSMIFNSFVLCQFFNQFNAREQEEKNVFKGILQNCWFWVAVCAFLILHLVFVVIEQISIGTASLNWKLWTCCFLIGIVSWVIDWAVKCTSSFIKKDWFRGWKINWNGKCSWGFIKKDNSMRSPLLPQNLVGVTPSAPPESG